MSYEREQLVPEGQLVHYIDKRAACVRRIVKLSVADQLVTTVDAEFDLRDVPEEYVEHVLRLLEYMPKMHSSRRSDEEIEADERFAEAGQTWLDLPFWRRWFTPRPTR